MLKKTFFFFVVILILASVWGYFSLSDKATLFLKSEIETRGHFATGGPFKIKALRIRWGLPLRVTITDLHFEIPRRGVRGNIETITTEIDILSSFFNWHSIFPAINMTLKKPFVKIKITTFVPPTSGGASRVKPQSNFSAFTELKDLKSIAPILADLRLNIKINNGELQLETEENQIIKLADQNLVVSFKNLNSPISIDFSTLLFYPL